MESPAEVLKDLQGLVTQEELELAQISFEIDARSIDQRTDRSCQTQE